MIDLYCLRRWHNGNWQSVLLGRQTEWCQLDSGNLRCAWSKPARRDALQFGSRSGELPQQPPLSITPTTLTVTITHTALPQVPPFDMVTVPQAATESIIFDVRGVTFLVAANDAAGTKATGDYVYDGEGYQEQIQEAKEVNCGKAKIFLQEV